MFESIFSDGNVAAVGFFIALGVALVCGTVFSFAACYKTDSSTSFFICTSLIPMTVAAVIALVNGNLGIGVAIAGAFGLVRFRSAQGSAREIAIIFIAMASGLAFGTGYLAYGVIFLIICGIFLFVARIITEKMQKNKDCDRIVKITIPESLDYTEVFTDVFERYALSYELDRVKSTNMGSMFSLTYSLKLKEKNCEKAMLDEIRTRNGNLEIQCLRAETVEKEL